MYYEELKEFDIKDLCRIRDAENILDEYNFADDQLLKEVKEMIITKSEMELR